MAEPWHVAVSPHNYNSTTVGLASTLHVSAGLSNFLITEYFVCFEDLTREISVRPFTVENSYITLPAEPGLGMELREEALLAHPFQPYAPRNLRHPTDEGL